MRFTFFDMLAGGIDWAVVLTFFAVVAVTFLAPVVGYRNVNRALFLTALWLLLGLMALNFLQSVLAQTGGLDRAFDGPGGPMDRGGWGAGSSPFSPLLVIFTVLKAGAYLAALGLFIIGLHLLEHPRTAAGRGEGPYTPRPIRPPREDEP